jgi:hypothetical protein
MNTNGETHGDQYDYSTASVSESVSDSSVLIASGTYVVSSPVLRMTAI